VRDGGRSYIVEFFHWWFLLNGLMYRKTI